MMPAVKDEAVALRRLDYSETSQVLVFLTRDHGPCRLIAKGIKRGTKKKHAVGIDLLERGDIVFYPPRQGSLGTMSEWRQVDLYLHIRTDIHRLYAAQYAAEITSALTEEADPHPKLFDALTGLLAALNAGDEPLPRLATYQWALLQEIGLQPDLTRCVHCDKPAPPGRAAFFSALEGGLICRTCEPIIAEKRKAGSAVLTAMRGGAFDINTAPAVFDLLDYMIAHTLGKPPKLAKFVRP